jgi:putative DNA primase/helicase
MMRVTDTDVMAALGDVSAEWQKSLAMITEKEVGELLDPTDTFVTGCYSTWFGHRFRYSPQDAGDGWRTWDGSVWAPTFPDGKHVVFAVLTVEILLDAAAVVPIPKALIESMAKGKGGEDTTAKIEAALRARMRYALRRYLNRSKLVAVLQLAAATPPIRIDIARYDADPWLLTVANGTLDLRTGTLRPSVPEDLCTRMVPIVYDPAARCERFMKFLYEVLGDDGELVEFVLRLIGSWLPGVVREHILSIWWGSGANGKTTLLNVIFQLLGPFGQVAPVSLLIEKGRGSSIPNDIARLKGVRFVAVKETADGSRLNEAMVKDLTGNERLVGRFLHKEFIEFDPTHKVALITNHKPVVRGQDVAIWRRLRLVPFTERFWKPDENPPEGGKLVEPGLDETLRSELPGILALAVRSCLVWQSEGLTNPKAVEVATAEYKDEENHLAPFIDERCDASDPEARTATKDLFADYIAWCEESRVRKPMSLQAFGSALAELGFEKCEVARKVKGRQGIKLRGIRPRGGWNEDQEWDEVQE